MDAVEKVGLRSARERVAAAAHFRRRNPPKSDDVFDDMVADALRLRHGNRHLARYGRKGQRQHGIDGHDPVSPAAERIVWQSTLQSDKLIQKIRADVASMDLGLDYRPRLFVVALGVNRDAALQFELSRLSVERQSLGRCAVEPLFWEDIHDILMDDSVLARKYGYPVSSGPRPERPASRAPVLTLAWTAAAEYVGNVKFPAASVKDAVLELPLSAVRPESLRICFEKEIAACKSLLGDKKHKQYWGPLVAYKSECESFVSGVLVDPRRFAESYVREYSHNARWFLLSLSNSGTAPASKVHLRAAVPPWLDVHQSIHVNQDARPRPQRPDFSSADSGPTRLQEKRVTFGMLGAIGAILLSSPTQSSAPKGTSLNIEPGSIDLHCSSLTHAHAVRFGPLGALAGPRVEPGEYKIDYAVFHLRDTQFRQGTLRIRLVATDPKVEYEHSLQDVVRSAAKRQSPA